jgi:hypothetical protein
MNKSNHTENDILGKYINPESIEKAPEGLTEKIMTRIQLGKAPLRTARQFRLNLVVPVIAILITLILIVLSVIFSSPSDITTLSEVTKYLRNLNFTVPGSGKETFSFISLPAIAVYITTGFFILTIFDRALNRFFRGHGK